MGECLQSSKGGSCANTASRVVPAHTLQERADVLENLEYLKGEGFKQLNVLLLGETAGRA